MLATGVCLSFFGAIGFICAMRNRHTAASDREMYEAINDTEPDFGGMAPAARPPIAARWLFGLAFTAVAVVIGWMLYLTVSIATQPPTNPAGWSDSPRAR